MVVSIAFIIVEAYLICAGIKKSHGEEVKPFDFAVTGYVGYDRGAWGSGQVPEPGGTRHDSSPTRGASLQVIYNGWTLLGMKPVFDFTFKYEPFRFDSLQAPIQRDNVDSFSFRLGLTKDFGSFNAYGSLGYTSAINNVRLIEAYPPLNHGHPTPTANLFSMKFGAFKMWEIFSLFGYKLKAGPEINIDVYPEPNAWSRCRKFHSWYVTPEAGLRIQW